MPGFGLQFPGDKKRWENVFCYNPLSFQKPDEVLLHNPSILKDTGTFQFHNEIVLGDGSALLLDKRCVDYLYKSSQEQVDRLAKFDKDWPSYKAKNDQVYASEEGKPGEIVWAPHIMPPGQPCAYEYERSQQEFDGCYYRATILQRLQEHWKSSCILVEYDNGLKQDVHISDLRKSAPPARGRGGDKRHFSGSRVWAPPFKQWPNNQITVDFHEKWEVGSKIKRVIGGIMTEFTVPSPESLPWNKDKSSRQFTLHMSKEHIFPWKYEKREWDKLNEEGVTKKCHSGEPKMFPDSPFPHYLGYIEKANPDGTIVVKWMNGYADEKYNPDLIAEDVLDQMGYRTPRKRNPYNPPDFVEGENVSIDYDRRGKCVSATIVKKNFDGTYVTSSKYREWGDKQGTRNGKVRVGYKLGKTVEEKDTPHDIIYKEMNDVWNMRLDNGVLDYPEMDIEEEKEMHRKMGNDEIPQGDYYKDIVQPLKSGGGMLAWCSWFRKSHHHVVPDLLHDVTQFCLSTVRRGREDHRKPAIFVWAIAPEYLHKRCKWVHVETVELEDVKGIPLLESIYNKVLKELGMEEGNGDLFAKHLMKFAEGRKKKTLRRWRPNQSEEQIDTAEKTKEEKQYEVMLTANVTLEKKHRQLEKEFRELKEMKEMKEMHESPKDKPINELSKENEMLRYEQSSQNRKPVVTQDDLDEHHKRVQQEELGMMMCITGGMVIMGGIGCLIEWLLK